MAQLTFFIHWNTQGQTLFTKLVKDPPSLCYNKNKSNNSGDNDNDVSNNKQINKQSS